MKKFLIFFMVLFGMACSAMADFSGYQSDSKGGSGSCVMVPSYKDSKTSYAVYFKTGEDKVSSECSTEFSRVKQELANLYSGGNIAYFVLVASADRQGDKKGYNNDDLSKRRYDYVVDNVIPQAARIEDVGWVAGSASAKEFEPEYSAGNWTYRSVYIYPVWALQKCEQKTMSNINSAQSTLIKIKAKYADKAGEIQKALDIITKLQSICKNSGDALTPSEGEKYAKLLSELNGLLISFINFAPELISITETITEYVNVTVYNTDISEYYYNLAKIRDGLKISVWRDAEGKFNTSRLISDSVAGVVLGTAGGLITSHLVKKNQIKQGFEDLNCSVGGQKVASYGDEIRIGLR